MGRLRWSGNKQAEQEAGQAFEKLRNKRRNKKCSRRSQHRRPFVRPDYAEYMNSKAWRRKRQEAFDYHGECCDVCRRTDYLQVHHLTYARLGREHMKDLQVLCMDCHRNHHEGKNGVVADSVTREFVGMKF